MTPKDFEHAKLAQSRLVKRIEALEAVNGIGICLSPDRDS